MRRSCGTHPPPRRAWPVWCEWQAFPVAGIGLVELERRDNTPSLRFNGALMPPESVIESVSRPSGNTIWTYVRLGAVVLSDLQVNLS